MGIAVACAPAIANASPPVAWEDPAAETPARTTSSWKDEWPEFSALEMVLTTTAGVGTLVLFASGPVVEPRWQSGILFDDDVRGALRDDDRADRDTARLVSDVAYYSTPALPFVVDAFAVSWVGRRDPKLARNLALVSLEAFSYSGLLSFSATQLSARERPGITECLRTNDGDESRCDLDSRTEAFWSGHTTIAATAAGLVCANHAYVPLWGHPVADALACALASANAATTAVGRIVADEHYATDVAVGSALGFGIGYAVPTLIHYTAGERPARTFSAAPLASPGARGLSVTGTF